MKTDALKEYQNIYIFGAKSRAKTLMGYLKYLFPNIFIQAFLIDNFEDNDRTIEGIPVIDIRQENIDVSLPVFLATKSIYHERIIQHLHEKGITEIIPITPDRDNFFRNAFVKRYYEEQNLPYVKIEELEIKEEPKKKNGRACIYVATSVFDKPLLTSYKEQVYEKSVQAGAALTKERLAKTEYTDCGQLHISEKNRQYCELTVLYWIWKNTKEEIVGLAHYRRHFVLPDQWQELMEQYRIDAILPVPTYVAPSIGENYKERHDAADWEYMMQYLKEHFPDDYDFAQTVYSRNLYLPCNMLVTRRAVLNELCEWMFPILNEVTRHGGKKEDPYLNRYPGFLSERLITLFFAKNRERFQVVYADKIFLN